LQTAAFGKGIVAMSWLKALAVGCVLAAQITTAIAADMPKGYPPEPLPLPRVRSFDFNSGWYVRGDIGYGWGRLNDVQSTAGFPAPATNSLGGAMTGGLGVGIKRDWIRTDLTADYLSDMKYQGTIAAPNDVTAKMSAWSVLLNGYLDLGSWYRISPYIGAGVGAAQVRVSDVQSTAAPVCRTRSGISPGPRWRASATP
jgi:opacity protein-like surface antigen